MWLHAHGGCTDTIKKSERTVDSGRERRKKIIVARELELVLALRLAFLSEVYHLNYPRPYKIKKTKKTKKQQQQSKTPSMHWKHVKRSESARERKLELGEELKKRRTRVWIRVPVCYRWPRPDREELCPWRTWSASWQASCWLGSW